MTCASTIRRLSWIALACLPACAADRPRTPPAAADAVWAAPVWIDAGPMLGHVSDHDASIWLRTSDPGVRVTAHQDGRPLTTRWVDLGEECGFVHLDGLTPGGTVHAQLGVASDARPLELEFRAAPATSGVGTVRFAFGSCVKDSEFGDAPIFRAMASAAPDMCLFLGDNTYYVRGASDPDRPYATGGREGDWSTPARMLQRQLHTRRMPELQALLRTTPCYAIWDDHDYGPNNSDSTFAGRADSLAVFRRVWANPAYGIAGTPGVFSSFRRGPIEVFLMDDRYHRTPEDTPDEVAAIWGDAQLNWLLDGLARSTAPVKFIANGTQMLNRGEPDDNHWWTARHEYYRLFDGLAERAITGVVFLSGDRHYSEAMRLRLAGHPDRIEFTSSPFQQGREIGPRIDDHPTRLFALDGNSFGLVTVDVRGPEQGTIAFECRDEHNEVIVIDGAPRRVTVELRDLIRPASVAPAP